MKYVTTAVILIRIQYLFLSLLPLDAIESGLLKEVLRELHIYIYIYFSIVSTHDKHAGLTTEILLHRKGPSKTSPVFEPKAILLLSEAFGELKTSQKHFPDSYQRCSKIGILGENESDKASPYVSVLPKMSAKVLQRW